MNERKMLFTLDYEQFNEAVSQQNLYNLQNEFKTQQEFLSQSLLIWKDESEPTWILADFGTEKTYDIARVTESDEPPIVQIWEPSSQTEQLSDLKDPEAILAHFQKITQGTHEGQIDFLKKIDLSEVNLEKSNRSDLSGAGFSFELVYRDLSTTLNMFQEILASPHESLLDLPYKNLKQFASYLKDFIDKIDQIENFKIPEENARKEHGNLLQTISNTCENAKVNLSQTITYLKSNQIEQLESRINATIADAMGNFDAEVSRAKKNNDDSEAKEVERQETFSQLERDVEDLIRKKSISSYEKIFADQAEEHGKGARLWLIITSSLTLGFSFIFWWLLKDLAPAGSQLPVILQNLVAKGFFLSLIYLLLNRSIKNYTAEKHLQTVNRHRQNALATFEEFEKAAGKNQETRDAVLLACTDAIFDANQSGYLSVKTSRSESGAPIQMVKGIVPTKPPAGDD